MFTTGELTLIILKCSSLIELRKVEDFVLFNKNNYDKIKLKYLYQILAVRNKTLINNGVERTEVYEF